MCRETPVPDIDASQWFHIRRKRPRYPQDSEAGSIKLSRKKPNPSRRGCLRKVRGVQVPAAFAFDDMSLVALRSLRQRQGQDRNPDTDLEALVEIASISLAHLQRHGIGPKFQSPIVFLAVFLDFDLSCSAWTAGQPRPDEGRANQTR